MTLQIESGKFYRDHDGRKVGPMKQSGRPEWPWIVVEGDGFCWNNDGTSVAKTQSVDLIAEWLDDQPAHIETRVMCYRGVAGPIGKHDYGTCIKRPDASIDWSTWEAAE